MEDEKCVKCLSSKSSQRPCRLCGTPVCFICVLREVVSRGRETFLKTSNWWCGNCSKTNKENFTPNVAQEAEEDTRCKKCGHYQPVSKTCPACKDATFFFCVGDDCWNISSKDMRWSCCHWVHKKAMNNCGPNKYALHLSGGRTIIPKLSLDAPPEDEVETPRLDNKILHECATSSDSADWIMLTYPITFTPKKVTNTKEDDFEDYEFVQFDEDEIEGNEEQNPISRNSRVASEHPLERSVYLQEGRKQLQHTEKESEGVKQGKKAYNEGKTNGNGAAQRSNQTAKTEEFSGKSNERMTKQQSKHKANTKNEENFVGLVYVIGDQAAAEAAILDAMKDIDETVYFKRTTEPKPLTPRTQAIRRQLFNPQDKQEGLKKPDRKTAVQRFEEAQFQRGVEALEEEMARNTLELKRLIAEGKAKNVKRLTQNFEDMCKRK